MEELDNKTIMCSVFFLDIVGYSKKSVTGQIALKDRFNAYLSAAIRDVPLTDRIILDTGDGAAINFIGDVEDALKAALSVRESLLNEDPKLNHPLLVRMGINLGPVRLVRDINDQPNIVGDGINVAQRVMGFAEAGQILVSRSYFDAVSRLSPQYADLFYYQGSRTDKHVREHEIYAIGYLGDATANLTLAKRSKSFFSKALDSTKTGLKPATFGAQILRTNLIRNFEQASPVKRVLYAVLILIAMLGALEVAEERLLGGASKGTETESPVSVATVPMPSVAKGQVPASAVPENKAVNVVIPQVNVQADVVQKPQVADRKTRNHTASQEASSRAEPEHKLKVPEIPVIDVPVIKNDPMPNHTAEVSINDVPQASSTSLAVICREGAEVFIDGSRKGKVTEPPLVLPVTPGRHLVIVSHTKGMDWQIVKFEAGQTTLVNPSFCN